MSARTVEAIDGVCQVSIHRTSGFRWYGRPGTPNCREPSAGPVGGEVTASKRSIDEGTARASLGQTRQAPWDQAADGAGLGPALLGLLCCVGGMIGMLAYSML